MILLCVGLPVLTLGLGFVRGSTVVWCANLLACTLIAGGNLFQTVWCGSIFGVTLVADFLKIPFHVGDVYFSTGLGLYSDFYTAHMLWIVFFISWLVHTYSTSYMWGDPRVLVFLSYLTLFTFFMVWMLVSPNLLQLFVGWEGVGLTSYLLVNFWHTRPAANKSALKALIVNRVGDFFFLYALFVVGVSTSTLDFFPTGAPEHLVAGIFLAAAACAKSAQLGLHTWLPDAMEGPTPVSALIHAATMVTAGIFLLLRVPHLLSGVWSILLFVGGVTTLFAGSVALVQFDLKRVIAYSTCSQLGYMVVALASQNPELTLYHLVNHAYFKALLFLLAGLVIHAMLDDQDIRKMGGLFSFLPVTYSLFIVGNLGLVGFPFLSGYYSKENILEVVYSQGEWFVYLCVLVSAYLTAYYSFRTFYLVFAGAPRGSRTTYTFVTESDKVSLSVVTVLGVFAVGHGYVTRDVFIGWGTTFSWSTWGLSAEFAVAQPVKLLPLLLSFAALWLAWSVQTSRVSVFYRSGYVFLAKRWWWDFLDSWTAARFLKWSYRLYSSIERGFLERVGASGIIYLLTRSYRLFRPRGWFPLFFSSSLFGFSWVLFLTLTFFSGTTPVFVAFSCTKLLGSTKGTR